MAICYSEILAKSCRMVINGRSILITVNNNVYRIPINGKKCKNVVVLLAKIANEYFDQ